MVIVYGGLGQPKGATVQCPLKFGITENIGVFAE